jgi:hypothetical protein
VESALAILGVAYDPGTGELGLGDTETFGCEWKKKLKSRKQSARPHYK